MFGKKQREIHRLGVEVDTLSRRYDIRALEASQSVGKLQALTEKFEKYTQELIKTADDLTETRANLNVAHEQIKDLAYENDDLNRTLEIYELLFKQLIIPIKIPVRKANDRRSAR